MKGEVVTIGHASPGYLIGWHLKGGSYPGQELSMKDQALTLNRMCGWTLTELALISELAKTAGHDEAVRIANSYRTMEDS